MSEPNPDATLDFRRKPAPESNAAANAAPTVASDAAAATNFSPASAPPDQAAPIGSRFGHYFLMDEIARGGMGVVFRARDEKLDRIVAIKMILSRVLASEDAVRRFYAEARAAARFDHPGIVPIYEIGELEDQHFFAMAFIDGESLNHRLRRGPLSPREAAALVAQVADAVEYAHAHGVIHRDLKPHNILLDADGRPKVTDFGLAKRLEDHDGLTASGEILGTPSYMAPEQAAGRNDRIDCRTDVYALGAVLYAALAGRPPFQASSMTETLRQVLEQDAVGPRLLNPSVPRDLETICLKCLEKEPTKRYASAAEFAADLRRWSADEPIRARRIGALERGWRWCKRRPLAAGLAVAVLLIAVLTAAGVRFAADAERARELARLQSQFDAALDRPALSAEYLQAQEFLATEIERRTSDGKGQQQARLHEKFAASIRDGMNEPRLSDQAAETLQAAIELLRPRQATAAAELQEDLRRKVSAWRDVFRLSPPYADAATVFPNGEYEIKAGGLRAKVSDPAARLVELVAEAPGETRWESVLLFAEGWESVHELGAAVLGEDATGYAFRLLAAPQRELLTPQELQQFTFSDARRYAGEFTAEIIRNGAPILQQALAPDDVRDGPLRLRVRREDDLLSLQVNDLPVVEFRDIFPLPKPQKLRAMVQLPVEVALAEFIGRRRQAPEAAGPLERGDSAYSAGDLAAALDWYVQQEQSASDPAIRSECRYKQGLCLAGLKRTKEAAALFAPLMQEAGEPWPAFAGGQLWLLSLRAKDYERADAIFDALSTRFRYEQLAAGVPYADHQAIRAIYLSQGYRFFNKNRVRALERLYAVDAMLRGGRYDHQIALRLFGAYWADGRRDDAEKFARDYLQQDIPGPPGPKFDTYTCFTVLWMRAERDAAATLKDLDEQLTLLRDSKTQSHNPVLLLLFRAKLLLRLGRTDEAVTALDDAGRHFNPGSLENMTELTLRGFIAHGQGDAAAAQRYWKAARDCSAAVKHYLDGLRAGGIQRRYWDHQIVAALNHDYSEEEANRALDLLAKLAGEGGVPMADLLANRSLRDAFIASEALTRAMNHMWDSRDGRAAAEKFLLDEIPSHECPKFLAQRLANQLLCEEAFQGDLTPEQEDGVREVAQAMYRVALDGRTSKQTLLAATFAWRGDTGFLGWSSFSSATKNDPTTRGTAAFLFAHRLAALKNREAALGLLQVAVDELPRNSLLGKLAAADQRLLKDQEGIVAFAAGEPVTLIWETEGREPRRMVVEGATETALPAGFYQVKVELPGEEKPQTFRWEVEAMRRRIVPVELWRGEPAAGVKAVQ